MLCHKERLCHYALLVSIAALLFFPGLGGSAFWDTDEGLHAETACEMITSGNLVVPFFNGELNPDKPPLLFWLQVIAYRLFGINEFSARLPSACAALLSCLVTYELGRLLYNKKTGIYAGVILASTAIFCGLARYAHTEVLLQLCTGLTFFCLWLALQKKRSIFFIASGVMIGLATLAKGPIGCILPAGTILIYLFWTGSLRRLFDWRWLLVVAACVLTDGGWYLSVNMETDGRYLDVFWGRHCVDRFFQTLETHGGPAYYYILALLAGFAPWSIFLPLALYPSVEESSLELKGTAGKTPQYRFLMSWAAIYFVFYSLAQTKLPHYIIAVFTPLAVLTGRFFQRWCDDEVVLPRWAFGTALLSLILMGMSILFFGADRAAIFIAIQDDRAFDLPYGQNMFESFFVAGVLMLGALFFWLYARKEKRFSAFVSLVFVAIIALVVFVPSGMRQVGLNSAPKALLQKIMPENSNRDIRLACYKWFEPSLVFYAGKHVRRITSEESALEFLKGPGPAYLFTRQSRWNAMKVRTKARIIASHYDPIEKCEVLVISLPAE